MKNADRLIALLVGLLLFLWLLPFARIGVDPHHDGIMLKPALDVLSGQTLFRETFSQYGALSCYLQVAALLIQPTLISIKILTVTAYAATLMVLYLTWRLFLPRSLAVLSCGLFALFMPAYEINWLGEPWLLLPWSSVLAMFFQALALHALIRVVRDDQPVRWGLLLGVASAATFWCRQPVGAVTMGTIAVVAGALHWTGWRPATHSKRAILAWTLGGMLAVHLALLGGIALSGALGEWWYQNFTWPRQWAVSMGGGGGWLKFFSAFLYPLRATILLVLGAALALPTLARRWSSPLSTQSVVLYYVVLGLICVWQRDRLLLSASFRDGGWTILLPAVVAIQAIVSASQAWRQRHVARAGEFHGVAAVAALSLSSLTQYYPVPDAWHVLWSLGPALGLGIYAVWRWSGATPIAITLVITALLIPSVFLKAGVMRRMLTEPRVTLESPAVLRGVRVRPAEAAVVGHIMRVVDPVLRVRPDIPAVMIGRDALYLCFINNRVNPSPYFVTWPGLGDEATRQARWNFVDRTRPLMFLHKADWNAVNDFYRRARYVPLLYLSETTLEIAVPQELADALGLKAYGANPPAAPDPSAPKP